MEVVHRLAFPVISEGSLTLQDTSPPRLYFSVFFPLGFIFLEDQLKFHGYLMSVA